MTSEVQRPRRPFTATVAVANRIRELDITPADLADKAGVSLCEVGFFGMLAHDRKTLERLSVALDWSRDHVPQLWDG